MKLMNRTFAAVVAALSFGLLVWAQAQTRQPEQQAPQHAAGHLEQSKPKPDYQDVKYGSYERNVLDLWKAPSDKPTPVLIHFHGGGFRQGDKSSIGALLVTRALEMGISVASANYRLSHQAAFPAPMLDGARAIQFLRYKAKEWNLDQSRIAATGGSAGAGISLWVGFHDDMADPKSADPVARQSTRLTCIAPLHGQSSYDLRFIKRVVGGRAHEHPALLLFFGLKPEEVATPKAYRLFEQSAAINYVSSDDPPVWMFYGEPPGPLPADAAPGQGIHHPNFGLVLKKKLDGLGIECTFRHKDDYATIAGRDLTEDEIRLRQRDEMLAFLRKHFKLD